MVVVDGRLQVQYVVGTGRQLVDGRLQVEYVVGTGWQLVDGSGRWQIAGVVCGRYWTVVSRWQWYGDSEDGRLQKV